MKLKESKITIRESDTKLFEERVKNMLEEGYRITFTCIEIVVGFKFTYFAFLSKYS